MATEWPPHPAPRRPKPWPLALVALACAGLVWTGRAPRAVTSVISSPSHLRQVEALSMAGRTAFYLHNAGFHLRHNRVLIGIVYGGGAYQVTWLGPDSVKIGFTQDWARLIMGHAPGVAVAFSEPS